MNNWIDIHDHYYHDVKDQTHDTLKLQMLIWWKYVYNDVLCMQSHDFHFVILFNYRYQKKIFFFNYKKFFILAIKISSENWKKCKNIE